LVDLSGLIENKRQNESVKLTIRRRPTNQQFVTTSYASDAP
jgi:hypothetical protein